MNNEAYAHAIDNVLDRVHRASDNIAELGRDAVENQNQLGAQRLMGRLEGLNLVLGYLHEELSFESIRENESK